MSGPRVPGFQQLNPTPTPPTSPSQDQASAPKRTQLAITEPTPCALLQHKWQSFPYILVPVFNTLSPGFLQSHPHLKGLHSFKKALRRTSTSITDWVWTDSKPVLTFSFKMLSSTYSPLTNSLFKLTLH